MVARAPVAVFVTYDAGVRRGVLAAVSGVALVVVAAASGASREPTGTPIRATRVVVIGVPGLGFDDLGIGSGGPARAAAIRGLADRGAFAAMNVRTVAPTPSAAEAYATLGGGGRVAIGTPPPAVAAVDEPLEGTTGAAALALRAGVAADRGLVVLDAGLAARVRGATSPRSLGRPGALGEALARDGRTIAVVASGGTGPSAASRTAALAAVDSFGRVPAGRLVPGSVTAEMVAGALERADVVVVDAAIPAGPGRAAALARADALVDRTARDAPPGTLVVVAAVTPPTARWELTPVIAWEPGMSPASLVSKTTKHAGLVTLADIGTTVRSALRTGSGSGSGMRTTTRVAPARLVALRDDALARGRTYVAVTAIVVAFEVALSAIALVLRRRGRAIRPLVPLAFAAAAFPLATYTARAAQLVWPPLALPVAALTIAVSVALGARSRDPLLAMAWTLVATVVVVLGDLAVGAPLETASLFGYSPDTASRFYGIGNSAMALVLSASILAAGVLLARRRVTVGAATFGLGLVALLCAFPTLGAKVGALVTILPVITVAAWAWAGGLTRRAALVAAGALAAIVGVVAAADLLIAPTSQTHLASTLHRTHSSGVSTLTDAVARRVALTAGYVGSSVWTEAIVVVAAVALLAIVITTRSHQVLNPGSPVRVAVIASLAGGLWAVLANDSGSSVVAIALALVAPVVLAVAAEAAAPPLLVVDVRAR